VVVKAFDREGNFSQETASLHILAPNVPNYAPLATHTTLPPPTPVLFPPP